MYGEGAGSRRGLARDLRGPSRLAALDGLRGACVLGVVVWHLYRYLAPTAGINSTNVPLIWWPMGAARFGVDAFFVLSGFFVVGGGGRRAWMATRERSASFFAAARDFLRRRARRTLPAYWMSLLILVPFVAPSLLRQPRHLLLFVTVNQYVVQGLPDKVNTVLWSLTTEWHFYLLVPLVALLMRRVGKWTVLAGCIALTVVWCSHVPPFGLPSSFIFGRLDQFVAGAVAAQLVERARSGHVSLLTRVLSTRSAGVAAAFVFLAMGTYHGSTYAKWRGIWFDPFVHPITGLAVAAGIVSLCLRPKDSATLFQRTPLRLAGLISYSLYLWHVPILFYGLRWAGVAAPVGARDGVAIAIAHAGCVLASTLSYRFVERPFFEGRGRADAPAAPERAATAEGTAAPAVPSLASVR
jgi:peptidoglycan/LPS O-acetylase OafA/YrhL